METKEQKKKKKEKNSKFVKNIVSLNKVFKSLSEGFKNFVPSSFIYKHYMTLDIQWHLILGISIQGLQL